MIKISQAILSNFWLINKSTLLMSTSNKKLTCVSRKTVENTSEKETWTYSIIDCYICNTILSTKATLEKHIATIHDGKNPFKRSICGYKCSQKESLTKDNEGFYFLWDSVWFPTRSQSKKKYLIASVHEGKKFTSVPFGFKWQNDVYFQILVFLKPFGL